MKKILIITLSAVLFCSCNDDFLEKYPQDKFTNETFWKTEGDFRTYALGLYDFDGFGVDNNINVIKFNSDETCRNPAQQDDRIFNRRVVPEDGGDWDWERLRSINIMVEYAQKAELEPKDKKHWEGVARLFRAREYFNKVVLFNDVPWYGSELEASSAELFKTQDPRSEVMDSVLADLNFAVVNIREKDEPNQINRAVALAIKSDICLFEGTYRKYHTELNLSDSDRWLQECVDASEEIMAMSYSLTPKYRDLYSSLDLASNPEVILYRQYENGIVTNCIQQYVSMVAQNIGTIGATRDAAEAFLCSDGLPFGVSDLHLKAKNGLPQSLEEEFENRDPRFSMCFVVPYRDGLITQLPAMDEAYSGTIPRFMPAYGGEGFIYSSTGYHPYKWWNPESPNTDSNVGISDAPLYTLNRVLLNYAEAMTELGLCTDEVLNNSINKLRERVEMMKLTVQFANSISDPKKTKYAPEISNLLWEIRRERQVELMMEGFRLNDILRWKKASYFSKPFVGAYVDLATRPAEAINSDGTPKTNVILGDINGNAIEGATKGYILPHIGINQPQYSDDDLKMYYSPINLQDLTLNTKLKQSPGW